jgi:sporulation protein YlmC with PRC-barrel domain
MAAALLTVSSLRNFDVCDRTGEKLGPIVDVMLDMEDARVRYAVLAYEDESGTGDGKLLALPITSLRLDTEHDCFVLDAERSSLALIPGFDASAPPDEPPAELAARPRPSSRPTRPSFSG